MRYNRGIMKFQENLREKVEKHQHFEKFWRMNVREMLKKPGK